MKIHSSLRNTTNALMVASMSTYLISPFAVSAVATTPVTTASPSPKAAECTKVQTFGQTALANIQSRLDKVNSDAATDATERLQNEEKWDATIAADWAKWDAVRQQNFTSLNAKATTAAQKEAVATFEQTVLTAVSTRRGSVTDARQLFRSTVASDATTRLNGVDSAIASFQSAVSSAVATAEANCSTEPISSLRSTFVASLKTAKSNFQTTLAGLPKLSPEVQTAATNKNNTIQTADNTFHNTVNAAAKTLKQVLGQS